MEGAMVSLVSVGQYTGLRRFFGNPMVPSGPALSRIGIPRSSCTRGIGSAGRGATGPVQPIEGQSSLRNLGAKPEPPLSPQDYHLIRIPLTAKRLASVCDA